MDDILNRIIFAIYSGQLTDRLKEILAQYNLQLTPETVKAGLIIFAVFLLALLFGVARHHMLSWSIKGAWFGIFFGMVVTLIVEAFLLVGGRTVMVEVLHNPALPPVVRDAIRDSTKDIAQSFDQKVPVLSAADRRDPAADVVTRFWALSPQEQQTVQRALCVP